MLEGGANVVDVQELLGHAPLDTRRCLEATADELREAIRGYLKNGRR